MTAMVVEAPLGIGPHEVGGRLRTPGHFLVRVGGLPLSDAEALSFPETARWCQISLELDDRLREQAIAFADRLAVAIADQLEPTTRSRLIKLKRDVFNGRRARDEAAVRDLIFAAAPGLADDLDGWIQLHDKAHSHRAAGATVFDDELLLRRQTLRDLADQPALRHGLLLSSRTLDTHLPGYLSAGAAPLSKRHRRLERSLVEYAYRAATKTSPFATFTTVCAGRFTSGSGEVLHLQRFAPGVHTLVQLNLATLGRIGLLIAERDDIRADLPVLLVTGLRPGSDRMSYLRRRRTGDLGSAGPMQLDVIHESLFYLPSSEVMRDLIELLADGVARPLRDVAAAIVTVDPSSRGRAEVDRYLAHLLRLGLLVAPTLRIDIHAGDPLAVFTSGLRPLAHPAVGVVADRLTQVIDDLARFPDADAAGRRELVDRISVEVVAAQVALGDQDAVAPTTALYEDVALPAQVDADPAAWGRVTGDLAAIAGLLPIFDISIGRRLVTKGYFRTRYGHGGNCTDLLEFAHEYQDDFFEFFISGQMRRRPFDAENRYVRQRNTFAQHEIDTLDTAREEAAHRVNAAYAALPPDATELVLGADFVADLQRLVPDNLGPVESHAYFLQLARSGPTGTLGVINKAFTGPALMLSRFAQCLTGAGSTLLAEALLAAQPPGVVLAELKGGYEATNLNLHPAATPYELVCPGDVSTRPQAEQIPIDDLVLYDDPVADRLMLRSRRLGLEVVPVYLGFLLPIALPEVQQVLLTFSPTGMAALDLWAGTSVPVPEHGIAQYPRIRFGEVVLQRRMWKASPDSLPVLAAGAAGHEVMLGWQRWRHQQGLPRRVFATTDGAGGGAPGMGGGKPMYVDFDSYFSVILLGQLAAKAARRLVLTEMLPDHHEQCLTDGGQEHVSELVLAFNSSREPR